MKGRRVLRGVLIGVPVTLLLVFLVLLATVGISVSLVPETVAKGYDRVAEIAMADLAAAGTVHGTFTDFEDDPNGRNNTEGTFSRAANGDLRLKYTRVLPEPRDRPDRRVEYEVLRVGDTVYLRSELVKMPAGKTWVKMPISHTAKRTVISPGMWGIDPAVTVGGVVGWTLKRDVPQRKPLPEGGAVTYSASWNIADDAAPDERLSAWFGLIGKTTFVKLKLAVDGSGRLVQLYVDTWGTTGEFRFEMLYRDFGKPVDTTPPPAAQVSEQLP